MADMLATVADLAHKLQRDPGSLNTDAATLLLETATGRVQGVVRQRLVQVVDDPFERLGTTSSWLSLPQRPVTAVTAVEIDGEAVTEGTGAGQWDRFGARMWRDCGWATYAYRPSKVTGTYTHGYADNAQELQPARGIVLAMCAQAYENATGARSEAIDDYRVDWGEVAARMDVSKEAREDLRRTYGRRGGLTRIGGS